MRLYKFIRPTYSQPLSKFVTTANIVIPYLSPYGYPNNVPVEQKMVEETKKSVTKMY